MRPKSPNCSCFDAINTGEIAPTSPTAAEFLAKTVGYVANRHKNRPK
jgi:hypothetical protein